MKFKLIFALAKEELTNDLLKAARDAGATGSTVISHAQGEGVEKVKTFLGVSLEEQSDLLLFLVEEHLSRAIMESLEKTGHMRDKRTGIAFQMDVEDAVGVSHQIAELTPVVDELM